MAQGQIRKPSVAGQFYPEDPEELSRLISSFAGKPSCEKQDVLGCLLPHAGYVYSGMVAFQTLSAVKIKDTLVLLGPNHSGAGPDFSLMPRGRWQTPFGNAEIDSRLAELLLAKSEYLEADSSAHAQEHSLEVELPLLQYFRKDFKFVPIAVKSWDPAAIVAVAGEMAQVISANGLSGSLMFIASSDMTHYEPQEAAEKKDALAIEAITALDEERLMKTVAEYSISMCGFAPTAIMLKAARMLGAKKGKLIRYQTSGDTSGDTSSVVGYAGITIY
jgi:AmmeMemoRadiSam system protein B